MTSLNAHCGPVDFMVATSNTLSPDMLKRDSLCDLADQANGGGGGGGEGVTEQSNSASKDSISQQLDGSPQKEAKAKEVLLQYRLRSTSQLPGKRLSPQMDQGPTEEPPSDSPEHSPEDGSIYELSEDPEVWVRGRPEANKPYSRRDKVTSAAVFSGGRGFRRLGGRNETASGGGDSESTLLVWQLPLTVIQ